MPARNKKQKKLSLKTAPYVLIAIGAVLFLSGSLYSIKERINRYVDSQFAAKLIPTISVSRYYDPVKIHINNLNINLAVKRGGINGDRWLLDDYAALFLPTSGLPGEGFNTVIYGHNTARVFGGLPQTNINDKIILENTKGKQYEYEVFEKNTVKPKDLDKIQSDIADTLTLFTCDGLLDQSRLVVKARLVKTVDQITATPSAEKGR